MDMAQQKRQGSTRMDAEYAASKDSIHRPKRYHTLSQELKTHFCEKIIKLSLDGGFTCPNRDGTISKEGCIFCSQKGSGEFAGTIFSTDDPCLDGQTDKETFAQRSIPSLHLQMDQQKALLSRKWPKAKYIAYFQNFSNTYGPASILQEKYEEALAYPDVVGLAIATRPDCLTKENIRLLSQLKEQTYLWVELGLQSIHAASAQWMNRGYPLLVFDEAVETLHRYGIPVVAHTIAGLPGETKEDFIKTAVYAANKGVWGIKIHMLHVLENTNLAREYKSSPFPLMSREEYIRLLASTICKLPPQIVLHRLTGDGSKEGLIAPRWTLDKRAVLNGLDQYLKNEDLWQGKEYSKE